MDDQERLIVSDDLVGYPAALDKTLSHITPLAAKTLPVSDCTDHINGKDLIATVDSPSVDASTKDGFAVRSQDVSGASPENPVHLSICGTAAAGLPSSRRLGPETAIRVLTGAKIPDGADAVVAEEYTRQHDNRITVSRDADPGRNIWPKGADVRKGEIVLRAGDRLTPGNIGLAVASGYGVLSAVPKPRVAILSTGDEVVLPGDDLPEGKLYASNMATLDAWCSRLNMKTRLDIVSDNERMIAEKLVQAAGENDAVLTSGGAWLGDRDLMIRVLSELGWQKVYHRVRMGPGKGAGFGFYEGTPIFILPGGPPSNLTAFLFLALPALMKMAGNSDPSPGLQPVQLKESIKGKKDWTRFVFGRLEQKDHHAFFVPHKNSSRLKSIAESQCIAVIPEGDRWMPEGETVMGAMLL